MFGGFHPVAPMVFECTIVMGTLPMQLPRALHGVTATSAVPARCSLWISAALQLKMGTTAMDTLRTGPLTVQHLVAGPEPSNV